MTLFTVGNNSTAETLVSLANFTTPVGFIAPATGAVTQIFCHVMFNPTGAYDVRLEVQAVDQGVLGSADIFGTATSSAPQTLSITLSPPCAVIVNQQYYLNISIIGPPGAQCYIFGGMRYDLWATVDSSTSGGGGGGPPGGGGGGGPTGVPGGPAFVPTVTPIDMSSWDVFCVASALPPPGGGPQVVDSTNLQRSQNGGASWSTVATSPGFAGVTFHDTGVSRGPLSYRYVYTNSFGDSAPSPVAVCPAPEPPPAPIIAPVSMTSWQVGSSTGSSHAVQFTIQRSTNGGGSWSTVGTANALFPIGFTDTGVPSGPLAYRFLAQNSVADVAGPMTTAGAPTAGGLTSVSLSEILT
jgi:hypothetical protein